MRRIRFQVLVATAVVGAAIVASCEAQTPSADPVARMQELVQSYAKSTVLQNEFMGSVLVAQGDKALLNQGYGSANLEWGMPNAPDTKFRLG